MRISSWWKSIYLPSSRRSRRSFQRRPHRDQPAAAGFEKLEPRVLLAVDWGDAPVGYPTTLLEDGARHTILVGAPQLGAAIDSEANGTHSPGADFDDLNGTTPDDEDGLVSIGTMLVGSLDVTATVNVQGAAGKLDAWIDFNGDGSWGGPGEQILDSVSVGIGNTNLTFDVPSWAEAGTTYARFRVSTAGDLGVGSLAADGEVEDYEVTILPPTAAGRAFSVQNTISLDMDEARSVFAADLDDDGDMDLIGASRFDDTIAWYENDGNGNFTEQTITTSANGASSVFAADVDGDGDTDIVAALYDVGGNDTIVWYENDGGTYSAGAYTMTINVVAASAAPTISTPGAAVNYTEHDSATVIDATATVSDVDSANFNFGTLSVSFSSGDTANDALSILPGGTVTLVGAEVHVGGSKVGDVTGGTGGSPLVISWNSAATPTAAQDVLRQIAYSNTDTSDFPSSATRTVDFVITDGELGVSNTAQQTINFTAVNDDPTAVTDEIDTDQDEEVDFDFEELLDNDTDPEGDTLTLTSFTQPANGTVVIDPESETFDELIYTPDPLYFGVDSFTYTVEDGNGGTNIGTVNINVAEYCNIAPALTTPGSAVNYTENDLATIIDATATVSDADSADFDLGKLFVSFSSGGTANDELSILPGGTVTLTGMDVEVSGQQIGSFSGGSGGTPLVISWNALAEPAEAQDVLRQIAYSNTSDDPSSATRTVDFVITDGDAGVSNTAQQTINFTAVNDDPSAVTDAVSTNQNFPVVISEATLLANDTDPEGDTLTLTSFTQPTNGAVVDNFDGTLTYTPVISYIGVDSFTYTVDDGNGGTHIGTVNVTVADPSNTAPALTTPGSAVNYTENDPATVIDATATVSDVDSANFDLGTLSVSISSGGTANDALSILPGGTVTLAGMDVEVSSVLIGSFSGGSGGTPLVIFWNSSATPTAAQAVLRQIAYSNSSDDPSSATRTVDFVIADGDGGVSNTAQQTINFTAVNDDPSAVNDEVYTDQDLPVVISEATLLANDTDPEGNTLTLTSFTQPTNGAVVDNLDGTLTYTPVSLYFGIDSFTYTVDDGNGGTHIGTVNVTVANHCNIAPALTTPGSAVNYTENDPATIIDATASVIDVDSADFSGGTLTIEFSTGGTANDELSILPGGTVTLAGMDVEVSSVLIGSVSGGSGGTPLVISWNALAGPAEAEAVMRQIAYSNSSDDPSIVTRTVDFVITDGDGGVSDSTEQTINVTAVNDDPTATNITLVVVEDTTHVFTLAEFNFADADGDSLSKIKITSLESVGSLKLNGSDVTLNQVITEADITAGNLTFTPVPAGNGSPYDSFDFKVHDGSEKFTKRTISTTAALATSVFAADVDGDGDLDVLSASVQDDKIAWYENDGSENFSEQTISTSAEAAESVFAADVDGDGDLDVLSASSYNNGKIVWYENDGSENFSAQTIDTINSVVAKSVFAADINGDGYTDVLGTSQYDDKIVWYKNDGSANPSFTAYTVNSPDPDGGLNPLNGDADGVVSAIAADVDGDGDLDILSASLLDDKIAWYENDGGAVPIFTQYTISTEADGATSVFAADVDGDGDLDVLSASRNDDKIAWYENILARADFDNNLVVDGLDFLSWQRGFGTLAPNATYSDGDADFDKDVDADDLTVWKAQYGTQYSSGVAPAAAVVVASAATAVAPQAESLRVSDIAIIDSIEDESSQPQSPYEFPSETLLVGIAQQAVGTEQSLSEPNAAASDEVFSEYSFEESFPRNNIGSAEMASVSSSNDRPNTRELRRNSDDTSAELTPREDALDEWFTRTFTRTFS